MAKKAKKPTKSNTKPVKGRHYTPPDASTELPLSFYKPLIDKGRKKGEIAAN